MNIFPALSQAVRPLIANILQDRKDQGIPAPLPDADMTTVNDLAAFAVEEALRVLSDHVIRAASLYDEKIANGVGAMSHKLLTELTAAGEEIMLDQIVAAMQSLGQPIPAHILGQLRMHRMKREG